MTRFSKWFLYLLLLKQSFVFSLALYMPYPSHTEFDHPINIPICRTVKLKTFQLPYLQSFIQIHVFVKLFIHFLPLLFFTPSLCLLSFHVFSFLLFIVAVASLVAETGAQRNYVYFSGRVTCRSACDESHVVLWTATSELKVPVSESEFPGVGVEIGHNFLHSVIFLSLRQGETVAPSGSIAPPQRWYVSEYECSGKMILTGEKPKDSEKTLTQCQHFDQKSHMECDEETTFVIRRRCSMIHDLGPALKINIAQVNMASRGMSFYI